LYGETVFENRFVRLIDTGQFWCLEDKTKLHLPSLGRHMIDLYGEALFVDRVETDEGKTAVARWYFPKSYPLRGRYGVLTKARSLAQSYERRLKDAGVIL